MSSVMPLTSPSSDGMHGAGRLVFWLAITSFVGTLLWGVAFFAVLSSDSGAGGGLAHLGRVVAPCLDLAAVVTMALECLTIGVIAVGAVRWQFRIVRNPRWIAAGVFAALAFLTGSGLILLYVVTVTAFV